MTPEEKKAYDREYARKHSAEATARSKAWREANPERHAEAQKAWREKNADKLRADKKVYSLAHAEEARARAKQWYLDNPERAKVARANWRKQNAAKVKADHEAWKKKNPGRSAEKHKKWRKNNPEQFKATQKRYKVAHAEELRAAAKARRERNADYYRAVKAAWNAANPEKRRQYCIERRAIIAGSGGRVTPSEIVELWDRQDGKCAYFSVCGNVLAVKGSRGVHRDHIEPLHPRDSNRKPGRHIIENIQLLCQACNHKKNNRDPYKFTQEHEGRLFPDLPRKKR